MVNNASVLGPSPQPNLADYPLDVLREVYEVNVVAPLALVQTALPALRRNGGTIVDITSDAGVEGYPGWGGYGSSKAALEQASNVLAAEEPDVARLLVRPGRHAHADAPGGVPRRGHLRPAAAGDGRSRRSCGCCDSGAPSGRYRAADRSESDERVTRRRRSVTMNALTTTERLRFDLPPALEAGEPPEARGITRDGVRMLVAERSSGRLTHSTFTELPTFLAPGDLVVVNTSGVLPAAIDATAPDGAAVVVHLSTRLDDGRWVVELRRPDGATTARWTDPIVPLDLTLAAGDADVRRRLLTSTSRTSARGCGSPACTLPQPVAGLAGGARPADPLRRTSATRGRSRRTRTSTPPSRAAPRCRAPAGRSPPR